MTLINDWTAFRFVGGPTSRCSTSAKAAGQKVIGDWRAGTPRILASGSLLRYPDVIDSCGQRPRIIARADVHRAPQPKRSEAQRVHPGSPGIRFQQALDGLPAERRASGSHEPAGVAAD